MKSIDSSPKILRSVASRSSLPSAAAAARHNEELINIPIHGTPREKLAEKTSPLHSPSTSLQRSITTASRHGSLLSSPQRHVDYDLHPKQRPRASTIPLKKSPARYQPLSSSQDNTDHDFHLRKRPRASTILLKPPPNSHQILPPPAQSHVDHDFHPSQRPRAFTVPLKLSPANDESSSELRQRFPLTIKTQTTLKKEPAAEKKHPLNIVLESGESCATSPSTSVSFNIDTVSPSSQKTDDSISLLLSATEESKSLENVIKNVFDSYFDDATYNKAEVKTLLMDTIARFETIGLTSEKLTSLLEVAQQRDKKMNLFQGVMGSLGYALLNFLFEAKNFTDGGVELEPHRFSLAYALGSADYLSGRLFRGYFQHAYYGKTIESNLPKVVTDFQKRHGRAEKLDDLATMMRPYVYRSLVRLGLNQSCLRYSGETAWRVANFIGDVGFGPIASAMVANDLHLSQMKTGEVHPIHLLTRRNADDVSAHISSLLNNPSYSREILNFFKLTLRDLPASVHDLMLTPHGLMHSALIMSTIEFLSIDANKKLNNMRANVYGVCDTNTTAFPLCQSLIDASYDIDFFKLAVILPMLYFGLFGISIGRQALSQNILSPLRYPLNYVWEKFVPDYGIEKSIKSGAEQLSSWWYNLLTPPTWPLPARPLRNVSGSDHQPSRGLSTVNFAYVDDEINL